MLPIKGEIMPIKWAVLQAKAGDEPLDLVVTLQEGEPIPTNAMRIFYDFHAAAAYAREISGRGEYAEED